MPAVLGFCPRCQRRVYVGEQDARACPVCSASLIATSLEEGRAERIVENEAGWRTANERIRNAMSSATSGMRVTCECGNDDCSVMIEISTQDYELVRSHPARFVVLPDHDIPEAERVVHRESDHWVVEKVGRAKMSVTEADPGA